MVSGQRRMHGAKTIAKALADIRFVSSCKAMLESQSDSVLKLPLRLLKIFKNRKIYLTR